jgi:integral membrane protein (TIGR01906 family)
MQGLAAACGLALLAVGLPLLMLEGRGVTAELSKRFSLSAEAGLTTERTAQLAEQVRLFVVRGRGELPATVDGREGFDAPSVSHLRDVHSVLRGAHFATGLAAALLAVWLGVAVHRRRLDDIARAFTLAAIITAVSVTALLLFALVDFDTFFAAFHAVFFAAGTWTFSYESLLIRLFPEPFWVSAGALWTVLMGLFVASYVALGRVLRKNVLREKS